MKARTIYSCGGPTYTVGGFYALAFATKQMHVYSIQRGIQRADLYRLVFNTRYVKYVVSAMMLFFLLHPVMPAFASELEAGSDATNSPSESVSSPVPETPTDPEPSTDTTESAIDEPLNEPAPETLVETTSEDVAAADESVSSDVAPETPIDESASDAGGNALDETESLPTEEAVPESSADGASTDTSSSEEVSTDDFDEAADTGTSTIPEPEFFEITNDIAHSDTHYQFMKSQCVSMGGGAFHCFDAATEASPVTEDALYVDRDSDGDKEIYLRTNGDVVQITDNKLDDDAPYFDPVSNTIVWHRLEGGQYNVYSYQDKRETLVSAGFSSSMEPHRSGQYTVWQSWIDNHWQVVLHDGTTARVISSGGAQSIAPQVEGAYVIWNVTTGETHTVAVYEIATGLTSVIDDGEGARVMNPRFVLVYDTKFENGDVITKGYDAETGDVIPLAAAAPVVPKELPSSDQTGETRALLQNKSSSRDEFTEDLEPTGTATSTPSGQGTDASGDAIVIVSTSTESTVLPLTDFDLIVEPFSSPATTTSSQ